MNSELLLKSIKELASALHTLGYHLPSHEDKDIVYGHLQRFEKLQAELRADMQINGSTPPQLNKTDCYTPLLDMKPTAGCKVCGGTMVFIRGKYPGADKREVCPTCAWERLEQVNELTQPNYGMAYKSNGV